MHEHLRYAFLVRQPISSIASVPTDRRPSTCRLPSAFDCVAEGNSCVGFCAKHSPIRHRLRWHGIILVWRPRWIGKGDGRTGQATAPAISIRDYLSPIMWMTPHRAASSFHRSRTLSGPPPRRHWATLRRKPRQRRSGCHPAKPDPLFDHAGLERFCG